MSARLATLATVFTLVAPAAQAGLIVAASTTTPTAAPGAVLTAVDLTALGTPSQTTITTPTYKVVFGSVAADQGVVQGAASGLHAIPVAGVSGGAAQYLVGNLGSAPTSDPAKSGNYFSTGGSGSTITITFNTPQTAIALLWGSIDAQNNVVFFNDAVSEFGADNLTGAMVQAAASGFVGNGFQGPGGSAYVTVNRDTTFKSIQFSSGVVSFEYAAVTGSDKAFKVPEPVSLALLGLGAGAAMLVRRRSSL